MQTSREQVDYNVRLSTLADLQRFSDFIKSAMVDKIAHTERFTAIRLRDTELRYNDWMHKHYGIAHTTTGVIEIGKTDSALQVAGTIIHELAHMMVGHKASHNAEWAEACKVLGLLTERETYQESDFTDDTLATIRNAIERFARAYPRLVYEADKPIPWPAGVGLWTCPREHESYLPCYNDDGSMNHWCHILEFQDIDIRWMLKCAKNILLANEMGTGKTVEMMGYINAVAPRRILVECPNNAKLVWKRHFQKYCVHPYDIEVAATQLYMFSDNAMQVVIMSYEGIARWGLALSKQHWDLVIKDEGHYLKNPSAARSKASFAIHGSKAVIITGTPIVNYVNELFPLIHYLDRENWPEFGRFKRLYMPRGTGKFGYNLNRLHSLLRETIMIRRFKKDVLPQLPRRRRQVIEFEVPDAIKALIDEEMELYEQLSENVNAKQAQLLASLKNESDVASTDIDWQDLVSSLHSTKRYAFERMAEIAHIIGKAKLPFVIEHIENALESKEKVIVFGHHRDVLTSIAKHFDDISVLLLGGNTNQAEAIMAAADRFNDDDKCRLFVAGIKLAQAYSLIGSSTVIFVEESWIPGDHTQAEDRAHGIGRGDAEARSMLIQHLVFEDSLDTKKAQLAIRKQKSIDRATGSAKHA